MAAKMGVTGLPAADGGMGNSCLAKNPTFASNLSPTVALLSFGTSKARSARFQMPWIKCVFIGGTLERLFGLSAQANLCKPMLVTGPSTQFGLTLD